MKNKKGFTLIELLAVIVILGLLIAIAIPSITRYITQSRKKTLATTISKYVDAGLVSVNNGDYILNDNNVIYAIPIECIPMEKGGDNPFGDWIQVNDEYWAYVLVQYDPVNFTYNYGFTFKDSAGYGMYPISLEDMNSKGRDIKNNNLELSRPRTGLASYFSDEEYWEKSGFSVNDETRIKVLVSKLEGTGDGENTCTLQQKGNNYEEIKAIKNRGGTLINSGADTNLVFRKEMNRTEVEEIYTLDYIDIPTDAIESWDASIQKNESIMAYITDRDKDNLYELYLSQEGGVIAPANSRSLFENFTKVDIINLDNFYSSNVTNMAYMFKNMASLTKIDLNKFNTSKVTDFAGMFEGMSNMLTLDVSDFDTKSGVRMSLMFSNMKMLQNLDVSNFNTSSATRMDGMFNGLVLVTSLDLSKFDTSSVKNMNSMFYKCESITSLDLSNFNTSNVTNMGSMFSEMKSLQSLNVSSFDTSNVTNMNSMFRGCNSLTTLILNSFNTSKVTDMQDMFYGCQKLVSVNVSSFDTSKVTNMNSMFRECRSLETLNISSFNTSNVLNMGYMFYNCNKLTTLDISNFDFSKVTSYGSMFSSVPVAVKIIVKDDDTRNWIQTNISSNYTNVVVVSEL